MCEIDSDIIFFLFSFFFLMYFDDLIHLPKWISILFYTVQVNRREKRDGNDGQFTLKKKEIDLSLIVWF